MPTINPEHIKAIIGITNRSPYYRLLSKKLCGLDIGYSKVEIELQNKHMNLFSSIHGGVYSSIIDSASYWSAYCELDEHAGCISIDLCVNNLAMINEGKITAEGKSIKIGKSLCMTEATVKDTTGRILAYGTSKLMILGEKQSIEYALTKMGHEDLPPKFLTGEKP